MADSKVRGSKEWPHHLLEACWHRSCRYCRMMISDLPEWWGCCCSCSLIHCYYRFLAWERLWLPRTRGHRTWVGADDVGWRAR
uniref:Uncharacterized protein n=1 Tax=Rhizophora mucronata TaxID=61149 RepID=A0A2P2Q4A1_RHIMU